MRECAKVEMRALEDAEDIPPTQHHASKSLNILKRILLQGE